MGLPGADNGAERGRGSALQEAVIPVPIRELPLARALIDEFRDEFRAEGRAEGTVALTAALLRRCLGDDARIGAAAEHLAALSEDEAAGEILAAARLEDLLP